MAFNPVQIRELRIAGSGISSTDTSISFRKMVLVDTAETPVTMAMFGTIGYITIEPKTDREENISFTGLTQNANGTATVTGVTRGLEPDTPYAENSDFKFAHAGGAIAVVSNSSAYYSQFGKLANDEVLTGQWTGPDPLSAQGLVTRDYMLGLINGGAITTDKVVVAGTAGETVAAGNLVYFDETDNEWKKTDADTAATVNLVLLGIAQGAGVNGGAISGGVLLWGLDENQSGMSQGDLQYASNTAGGISSTTGTTEKIIGIARNTTTLYFDPDFYYRLTIDQKNAIAGSTGTPSSTNKFITQDNTSESTTDQTQTTQNGTIETGEADLTTKKNLIAQSFIPTKTKIRGVTLYKSADTGTFTGTVVVTLQADNAGSPSGTPLATATISNITWLATSVGEIECLFASEYSSVTPGSLYWIVIDPSTSDTSNHPNMGTNTAGGYTSGSVKYKNTTDSWVAVSTIDLYFKTLEGNIAQIIKTNSTGKMESAFYSPSEMPIPAFFQELALPSTESITLNEGSIFGSNQDGSVIFVAVEDDTLGNLYRFERDSLTGSYLLTHNNSPTIGVPSADNGGIIVIGLYIYFFTNNAANITCSRFLAADLTGETGMTIPTVANTDFLAVWTDGVSAYVVSNQSDTTSRKWTLSGTTFTADSTGTVTTGTFDKVNASSMFDGTSAYYASIESGTVTIRKLTAIDGSSFSSTTKKLNDYSDADTGLFIINIDTSRMYIGRAFQVYGETGIINARIVLFPITKP